MTTGFVAVLVFPFIVGCSDRTEKHFTCLEERNHEWLFWLRPMPSNQASRFNIDASTYKAMEIVSCIHEVWFCPSWSHSGSSTSDWSMIRILSTILKLHNKKSSPPFAEENLKGKKNKTIQLLSSILSLHKTIVSVHYISYSIHWYFNSVSCTHL